MRRREFIAGTAVLPLASSLARPARAQAPRRGGTMTIVLQPEPPMLMLGINQAAPAQVAAGRSTRAC
jgi:peptide/nickel transport system substrate-binding protein